MASRSKRWSAAALVLVFFVLGCGGTQPFRVSREEFFSKVHKLAFTQVEFNVEMGTAAKKEKQLLAQHLIEAYLQKLGKFEVILPDSCESVRQQALQELKIDGFYDPKTGQRDEAKFASFSKYFIQKVGADAWLYVSYVPGTTVQTYETYDAQVTRTVTAVDLFADISDPLNKTLWSARALVGAQVERKPRLPIPCIGGCLGYHDVTYAPEQVMTDAKVKLAVSRTFKSLK